ncbi:translation factor [Leptolyngbya sp. Heron Island J]|uniref:L-threonylcarbamoyladenylate synthase n=1 Tax=Leptolyngbya sp. Heron Island J TaxID=1385935 RepID=UPI0003B943C4|nr:L-threonylcarbamoyladenylate synthase [Leptolyngbya sp. Heron Island J]ESA33285.1 translation factor [Leptolyngbya sp. Heron Island J]
MPYVSLQNYVDAACSGSVVALPTDTVWGVATAPDHSPRLYELKQRSFEKSLILMGASASDLWPYITLDMAQWKTMTEQYWPGQLTLVVPASPKVPMAMHPKTPDTIGVRVPDHPIARQILTLTGPLATTSANLSGQPTLMTNDQVLAQFPQVYGLDEQAWQTLLEPLGPETVIPSPSGLPSTVAGWQSDHWETIRQGTVYL